MEIRSEEGSVSDEAVQGFSQLMRYDKPPEEVITASKHTDEAQVFDPLEAVDERTVDIDQSLPSRDAVHQSIVDEEVSRYEQEGARHYAEFHDLSFDDQSNVFKDVVMRNDRREAFDSPVILTNFRYDEADEGRRKVYRRVQGEVDLSVFDPETLTVTATEVKSANYLACIEYAQKQIDEFASYVEPYGWTVNGEIAVFDEKSFLADGTRAVPESGPIKEYAYNPQTGEETEHPWIQAVVE